MKKELYVARPKKICAALLTSMLFFASISDGYANNGMEKQISTGARVEYVGSTDNLLTFNVQFVNTGEEKFILELTDEYGEVLYHRTFSEKQFNKNIQLKKVGEKCQVNFTIRTAKQSTSQRFEIDAQTRLVQETVVTKV